MMVNNKGNDYNDGVGIDNNEEDGNEWKLHHVLLLRTFCLIVSQIIKLNYKESII